MVEEITTDEFIKEINDLIDRLIAEGNDVKEIKIQLPPMKNDGYEINFIKFNIGYIATKKSKVLENVNTWIWIVDINEGNILEKLSNNKHKIMLNIGDFDL